MARAERPSGVVAPTAGPWRAWHVAVLALVVLLPRLVIALAGPDAQLSLMVDDASYYLEAARRAVATGAWPTTDGLHATNGFHPLYMGLLMAVHAIVGDAPRLVIPVVMTLDLALNALAIALLLRAVARRGGPGAFATALVLALGSAWWLHATMAVENGLSSLLLLLMALRWESRFGAGAPAASWRACALDGLGLGLAILGRTDAGLFAVAYAIGAMVVVGRSRGARAAITETLVITAIAGLVVAPWAIANLQRFGTVAQDSATALAVRYGLDHGPHLSPSGLRAELQGVGFWLYRFLWATGLVPLTAWAWGLVVPVERLRSRSRDTRAAWLVVALAIGALLLRDNGPLDIRSPRGAALEIAIGAVAFVAGLVSARPEGARWRPVFTVVSTAAALDVLAYAIGFRGFQVWYATGPTLACVLFVASAALPGALAGRRALTTALVGLVLVQGAWTLRDALVRGGIEGMDRHILADGEALRGRLEAFAADSPTPVVFGSFDSGELAYVVHPFPVINLDGVMNHDAAVAIRERALARYMVRAGVTHLLTSPLRIEQYRRVEPFTATFDSAATARIGMTTWVLGRDSAGVGR